MSIFNNKFESVKQDWETPDNLFNFLNKEFNFEFDLAASKENSKCIKFFSEKENSMLKIGKVYVGLIHHMEKELRLKNG